MPCKHEEEKDKWNETMSCYQKLKICNLSGKQCSGSEGICSLYEEKPEPKQEVKEEKPAETQEAVKEEDGKVERS